MQGQKSNHPAVLPVCSGHGVVNLKWQGYIMGHCHMEAKALHLADGC